MGGVPSVSRKGHGRAALPQRASEARCPQPRGVRPEWHAVIDALLCEEPGLWEGEVRAGVKVKTLVEGHRALTETAGLGCWRRDWGALGVLA